MVGVMLDVDLKPWAESCGVTVCELICPLVVFSRRMADHWVNASVVFCESHFEQYGVVWPFLCFVVCYVVGVALIVRADGQLDVVLPCGTGDVLHQSECPEEFYCRY